MNTDWHFGVNDPDPIGWLICIGYLVVAVLCGTCARRSAQSPETSGDRRLWWGLAALMLLLGVNKQLDLQTPFIALGRAMALTEGWYPQRRLVQWVFIACLGFAGLAPLAWIGCRKRRGAFRYALPLCGIATLVGYVLLEAAPIRVSDVLGVSIPISNKRVIVEVCGICCIGLAAVRHLRSWPRGEVDASPRSRRGNEAEGKPFTRE